MGASVGSVDTVRVAFGTDEETGLTAALVAHLRATGHTVVCSEVASWPEVGRAVGDAVASGAADRGVVCCWTGTGVSIAANKVAGVRAALCTDAETARGARRWNDANVVALGLRLTSDVVGCEIVDAFLEAECDEGEAAVIARLEPRVDH
jgi:ribose 5-phosphate isomerase B